MGRYKDYQREPRSGGDDNSQPDYRAPPRARPYSTPSPSQRSEPTEAVVKWFDAGKGFGFISLSQGTEAFIHISRLQAAGHTSLAEGARVKVRIGPGKKGPEVTELLEVDTHSALAMSTTPRTSARPLPHRQIALGPTEERTGTVKWYNVDKGFGFVEQNGGGKDVFVHAKTLQRAGLSALTEGQRVRMQISQGQKGPEARALESLD
jgi:CspA family cold shock protein